MQTKYQTEDIKRNTIRDTLTFPEKKVSEIIKSLEKEYGKFPISNVNSTVESESYHIEIGGGDYLLYTCSNDLVTLHWFNSVKQVLTQVESITYTQLTNILRFLCDRNLTKLGEVKEVKEVTIFDRLIQRFGIPNKRSNCEPHLPIDGFEYVDTFFYSDSVILHIYQKEGVRPESKMFNIFMVTNDVENEYIRVNYFQDLDKYLSHVI